MIHRVSRLEVAEINRILELIQKDTSASGENLKAYINKKATTQVQTPYNEGTDVNSISNILNAIDNDDVLTTKEKRILIPIINGFTQDRTELQPQADALGFNPDNPDKYAIWVAYSDSLDALIAFLEGYGKNSSGNWRWSDVSEDLPLGTGNGEVLRTLRDDYASTYATLRAAMWAVTYEIKVTAELAESTAVQAAQDAPKVVSGLPTLPNTDYPVSKLVYDTVAKRLYRSTGTTWEAATVTHAEIVDQLIAGQISAGAIGATELAAGSVYAKHLVVANYDNLIPNPGSEDLAPDGTHTWPSSYVDGNGVTASGTAYSGSYIRRTTNTTTPLDMSPYIQCVPGDQFIFQAQTRGSCKLIIAWYDGSKSLLSTNSQTSSNGSWASSSVTGTSPSNTSFVKFQIQSTSSTADFDALYARRMADANMMVDGTITALYQKVGAYIQSTNYVAGSTGVAPTGFKLASSQFSVTYKDGSTATDCLFEIGGTASFNGYRVDGLTNKILGKLIEYTSAGTYSWTAPEGIYEVEVTLQGGGGNGASSYGGGGGGGQYIRKKVSVTPGTAYSIVVGGAATSTTGFSLTANGGSSASGTTGGNGTIGWARSTPAPGGTINNDGTGSSYAVEDPERGWDICGSGGGGGSNTSNYIAGDGGPCGYIQGGFGGGIIVTSRLGGGGGGASAMAAGGDGGTQGASANGVAGTYGSGGGGGATGGAGGVGYARIRW